MSYQDLPGLNDPTDPAFRGDFLGRLQPFVAGKSDADVASAIMRASWYGKTGSGSNPYAAAVEVGNLLGTAIPGVIDQATLDADEAKVQYRSPEAIARRNKKSGLGDLLIPTALAVGAYFAAQPALAALTESQAASADIALGGLGGSEGAAGLTAAGYGTAAGASASTLADSFSVKGALDLAAKASTVVSTVGSLAKLAFAAKTPSAPSAPSAPRGSFFFPRLGLSLT